MVNIFKASDSMVTLTDIAPMLMKTIAITTSAISSGIVIPFDW
jgi:hypothetical protein